MNRRLTIPAEELQWRFSTSGGPGGQHANRTRTRVDLRFDVASSRHLGPRQKARLLERLGPVARVVVSSQRSQQRNRALARERLAQRLALALREHAPRRPTVPPAAAAERRLDAKRRQAAKKRARRPPALDGAPTG
ncbi:MAG TPA: alternative ribosome rescue aminoacyl-tRNA hydrolase ArfB [Acidimicrobiales bacterium]|nr:alternative ribosome rescue aminoacyl-tRNA hydrolase ArfB [Acidimicrobiales bacterium]